ncbi:MAG: DUF4190 domain-containing protein [Agathobacter sp.]|nr:DUF4190 domain-containing protein [Agathobacter sp.]MBQ2282556.1 DUF4190 domain-containing protein [Agathobacter sp.]
MDQQFYNQQYNPMPPRDKRSRSMETASLVLGLISFTTCTCLYISLACGALAILLGILSKGGELTMSNRAQAGVIMGILGLVFTVVVYAASFAIAISAYGSIEGILQAYCEMYGIDYTEFYNSLFSVSP